MSQVRKVCKRLIIRSKLGEQTPAETGFQFVRTNRVSCSLYLGPILSTLPFAGTSSLANRLDRLRRTKLINASFGSGKDSGLLGIFFSAKPAKVAKASRSAITQDSISRTATRNSIVGGSPV